MSKKEIMYVCNECGNEFSKWSGKCLSCGSWNTLKEYKIQKSVNKSISGRVLSENNITSLKDIEVKNNQRIKTTIDEFDRVLGGGIVSGSLLILGGDPGIGKSTIMLEIANKIDKSLYISGEESLSQIKSRAKRLNIRENLEVYCETSVNNILKTLNKQKDFKLVIIDSIQTMYDENFPSTPGSLVQVRETAMKFQNFAKEKNIAIILVGHVTKEGSIAGPRTLEHLVDGVFYLEGDRYQDSRILRSIKNRFGSTDEIGVFTMTSNGLKQEKDISKLFIKNRSDKSSGSVLTATLEGSRTFLVEIQALVIPTVFGYPKRTTSGFDLNRLNLLLAVLSKRAGINLSGHDVYLNVSEGFKLKDPGADLAVCLAIASVFKNIPINSKTCVFGEVGLSGEIRPVNYESKRRKEIERLGLENVKKYKYLFECIKDLF